MTGRQRSSSKVAAPTLQEEAAISSPHTSSSNQHDRRPICTHFLQGRCNYYGDRCRKRHETAPTASHSSSTDILSSNSRPQSQTRRPHPRPPPRQSLRSARLLRQLLRNEIEKHVDAVGQAIRIYRRQRHAAARQTEEGQAEEQRMKRDKIQILPSKRIPQRSKKTERWRLSTWKISPL